jgi:hypothetical protein
MASEISKTCDWTGGGQTIGDNQATKNRLLADSI